MRTYRPPLCAVTAALVVTASVSAARAGSTPASEQATAVTTTLEGQLLSAINQFRASRGQRPFRFSTRLHAAALRHSREMASNGYFEHASPNGSAFWRRISWYYRMRGYRDWSVGENIEYGQPGLAAGEVLSDWLASPAHRANVVSTQWRDARSGRSSSRARRESSTGCRRRSSLWTSARRGASRAANDDRPEPKPTSPPWEGIGAFHPPPAVSVSAKSHRWVSISLQLATIRSAAHLANRVVRCRRAVARPDRKKNTPNPSIRP